MPSGKLAVLLSVVLATQFGCAYLPTAPYPTEQDRRQLGTVGVVVTRATPAEFSSPTQSKTEGAATGAAAMAAAAGGGAVGAVLPACMAGGPIWGAACAAGLGAAAVITGIGAAVGGVLGAEAAPSEETVKALETAVNAALTDAKIDEAVRSHIVAYGRQELARRLVEVGPTELPLADGLPAYRPLTDQGIDSVLEISEVRIWLAGGAPFDPTLTLQVMARAKLLRLPGRKVISEQPYAGYASPPRTFAQWGADNARAFREGLDQAFQVLAEWIVDELFLLHAPATAKEAGGAGVPAPSDLLRPEYPPLRKCGLLCGAADHTYPGFTFPETETLPTLRWAPLREREDLQLDPGRVTNISYDLKLYGAERAKTWWVPGRTVYERKALPSPSHTLEFPLEQCKRYMWTVRARFELDGQPRVTEWTGARPTEVHPWGSRARRHLSLSSSSQGPDQQAATFFRSESFYFPLATSCREEER